MPPATCGAITESRLDVRLAHPRLLPHLLQLLPKRLLAALDAWSYRLACQRAEQRRRRST